jgi:ParB-like chromosome segregation protein Spo0J
MPANHRYQVMPPLSPEAYEALKADIQKDGVKIPKDVDEEGNILDGFSRDRACKELGRDCPERVIRGLTDAEKREYAWRMNLTRRHLSKEQKREIARTLRQEGWTQDLIAQALCVGQRTVSRWLRQSSHSAKLSQPDTVLGKDGKRYPPKKALRRPAQPTEGVNRPDSPFRADAEDRSTQGLERGDTRQPRGTHAEAQLPVAAPLGGSDALVAPETLAQAADEPRSAGREQPSSAPESGPVASAEDDAEAHWVDALQDLLTKLERLHVQGGSLPPSRGWAPETKARAMATIQHMQERLKALEAVVASDMGEVTGRNGQDDMVVTSPPVGAPVADEARERGKREPATVSSAEEDRAGGVVDGDPLPSQAGGEGNFPRDQGLPLQEEDKRCIQESLAPLSRPSRATNRKGSPGRTRTRRSNAELLADSTSKELTEAVPGASTSALTEISGSATIADPVELCSPDVQPAEEVAAPAPQDDRCGWCGSTSLWSADTGSGRIHCLACHAVYNPSTHLWAPGQQDKRQNPPASMPATAA